MVYCVEAHRVSGVWLAHRLVREPIALVGVVSSMRVDGGVAWAAMAAEIEVMIVMAAAARGRPCSRRSCARLLPRSLLARVAVATHAIAPRPHTAS